MTDYFALLDQPRRPWLDLAQLKEIFHARTLVAHPDAQASAGLSDEAAFAELNEAYQVLRDPKRRLHHLLTLEGDPPSSRSGLIPKEIESLFPLVATLTHESDELIQRAGRATGTLSRSLLQVELRSLTERVTDALASLAKLHDNAETRLQDASGHTELHALYLHFSYLTKWLAELQEKQLRLTHEL